MTAPTTRPVSIVSATGMLGTGFLATSLDAAIALGARAIGCDAGSSDSGPYFLGSGKLSRSHSALKRDLELMILAGRKAKIPVAIGSAVNAGADAQLAEAVRLVEEIASEHRLDLKVAVIHSELSREWLLDAWRSGRVRSQPSVPELDEKTVSGTAHLVAQMGPEPLMAALDAGADVVIAGRASDAAIFAALAMRLGVAPGPAWHAGKILECGAAPAIQRLHPDCILATFEGAEDFTIQIPNPQMACSELSVRAHGYYENADPFQIHEPGGTIDTAQSRFTELGDGRVRVGGSRFLPAERYEIRVEGSRLAGYRSIAVAGISDPILLDNLDEFLSTCEAAIVGKCRESLRIERDADYRLLIRRYGTANGPPDAAATHRVGLVFEVVAATQANARAAAAVAVHTALHHPVRNWQGFVSNLAIPFSPAVFDGGAVYEWSLNHLVAVDDPCAPFRMEMKTLTRERGNAAR
jgi:hypothetical protein